MNAICPASILPLYGSPLYELSHCPKTSELVDALVSKTKAPRELVLMQTLSFYSILLQQLIDVERPGVGRGPVSLYTLTIADSGERKTTVSNLLAQPIIDFQMEEEEAYFEQLAEYEIDMEIYQEELKNLKKRIAQEIKNEGNA
jgi:hypothetical protein